MLSPFLLCCLVTFLIASSAFAAPLIPDKSCVPDASEAPYRLPISVYQRIVTDVRAAVPQLRLSGCSIDILQILASCSETQPSREAIHDALSSAPEACQEAMNSTADTLRESMIIYGCVSRQDLTHDLTTSDLIHQLKRRAHATPSSTTCYALIQAARRAYEDALQTGHDVSSNQKQGAESTSNTTSSTGSQESANLWLALLAGAFAGLAVDLALFPLDTIKTRLQSSAGFAASGGFKGLYQGIGSIALGSAPSSALFFIAYEFANNELGKQTTRGFTGHLIATTLGEVVSSLVRVPADVVKSRQQVENTNDGLNGKATLWTAIGKVYEEGLRPNSRSRFGVFYTGWLSAILREIPFGCIQFPLFSYLKEVASAYRATGEPLGMLPIAVCGMIAGAVAGSVTTPLDVVKTRIMLAEKGENGIIAVMRGILRSEGLIGLFKGVIPRTLWISLGGAIFLGGYDGFKRILEALDSSV